MKHIPWHLLPRTFQDAFDLTWRLGLKYLWVDSLCIVQDDELDWRNEGSNMATTYSRSYVTLAAAKSADANGGFYTNAAYSEPRKISSQVCSKNSVTIYVCRPLQHQAFFEGHLPLMLRAWAYQERVLSPRIVHFTSEELFWECTTKRACECGYCDQGFCHGLEKGMLASLFEVSADGTVALDELRMLWYQIVHHYSPLALSFGNDIFPALQGIAKLMQISRKAAYYAGIWKDTAAEDLLWQSLDQVGELGTGYRAPSWSWASRRSRVWWYTNIPTLSFKVVSISTTLKGTDPTGEVTAGVLVLRSKMVPILLHFGDGYWMTFPEQQDVGESGSATTANHAAGVTKRTTGTAKPKKLDCYCDFDVPLSGTVQVFLLQIAERSIYGATTFFFLLRLVPTSEQLIESIETYERIGIGSSPRLELSETFEELEEVTVRVI